MLRKIALKNLIPDFGVGNEVISSQNTYNEVLLNSRFKFTLFISICLIITCVLTLTATPIALCKHYKDINTILKQQRHTYFNLSKNKML